ncbi:Zn(2)-Cys(6) binuclear cluster domain-containing protein [Mycena alexandri]|uniref:Zn(2)-Cys(6) binuclear cluster domain-containing protein n=1 Tax=Mycena alexandri TaxID=1745969 RepID=A0AAD6WQG7_9AGAR|nr:Zn(2)-Cys(6) binuclear cluster domain-containing protein [Mycena alexandri]
MTQNFFTSSPTSHSPRSNLPRGKACMNCRRRKIKCDGHKPICSQCMRSPGTAEDCEYPLEGRSRTQQLEETIKKLQSRIGELEATANDGRSSILLHEPYDAGDVPFMALEMSGFLDSWSTPGSVDSTSPTTRVNSPTSSSSSSSLVLEEPPSKLTEGLVDAFLENFSQVGFFLDPVNFRQSALLGLPFGHYERPSPALLSAVYMWGSRLSQAPRHPVYNDDAFLLCTLQNIHQDLGGNHPHRVMHSIQAEVLLSIYYLTLGRPVEGIYHSSAAVSLAISAGLHLIKSSLLTLQPCFGVLETPFPPPTDGLEEGERINAFWTVVVVNNYWVAAHGSPSAIPYHDTPIDTPWPLELGDYAASVSRFSSHLMPSAAPTPQYQQLFDGMAGGGGSTVTRFLAGFNVDGFSALALLSKASILLERAITLSTRYSDHSDAAAFDSLDLLLEQFEASLPLAIELQRAVEMSKWHSLLITQTLTHAAIIRLHAHRIHSSEVSRGKYRTAARAVVHLINNTDFSSKSRHIDPIIGILWATVSEVFVAELSNMRNFGMVGRLTQQHQDLVSCIETILSTMRVFSSTSPLIEYFSNRIQQAYHKITASS